MPQIPTFDNTALAPIAPGPPRADPSLGQAPGIAQATAGQEPGLALAQVGQNITSQANEFNAHYAEAMRQSDASDLSASASAQMNDLRQKYSMVPDRRAALTGFNEEAAALRDATLAKTNDPLIRSIVGQQMNQMGIIYSHQVDQAAFGRQSSAWMARQDQNGLDALNRIAANPNPLARAAEIDNYRGAIQSGAAAGWITPEGAQQKLTHFQFLISQDDVMRDSAADPVGTFHTLSDPALRAEKYPYLPPEWADHFAYRLQGKADSVAGKAIANRELASVMAPVGSSADGNAVAPDDMSGAGAIHAAFLAQGVPNDEALAWTASALRESSGDPGTVPGDGGASHGLFQWNGDRLREFQRQNNGLLPEQAGLDANVRFALWEKTHTESAAGAAIDAAQGAPAKAAVIASAFLRPKDAAGAAAADSAMAGRLATAGQIYPDFNAAAQGVINATGDSPARRAAGLAEVSQAESQYKLQTAATHNAITRNLNDATAALEAGKDDISIPDADIRRSFPADQASEIIGKLAVAKNAGQVFRGVQWDSPDDMAATRQDLASGLGVKSSLLRASSGEVLQPQGDSAADTPSQFVMRQKVLATFDRLAKARASALANDPAGYVASNPLVQSKVEAMQAIQDNAPDADARRQAAFGEYVDASLAVQRHLGVPDSQTRVLNDAQVTSLVDKLHSVDPAKGDMGAALDGLAKQYGDYYPQVMKDLVTRGKLNPDYMVLGAMDTPAQAGARQDFQRALLEQNQGAERFEQSVPKAEAKAINDGLDTALQSFRATTAPNGVGGQQLFGTIRDSVKTLAMHYATQGDAGPTALDKAVAGIIGDKYDMDGSLRVPKGMLDEVRTAAQGVQGGLQPSDLAAFPELNQKTPEERSAILLDAARRGTWATNAADDGAVLMGAFRTGPMVMRGADGNPITIKFKSLPQPSPSALAGGQPSASISQPAGLPLSVPVLQ